MFDLIKAGVSDTKSMGFDFFLDGDLCQMAIQKRFLSSRGVETQQNNVYPCLRQSDVPMALKMIWDNKVEGWWHYQEKYAELGICTKEEFLNRLKNA